MSETIDDYTRKPIMKFPDEPAEVLNEDWRGEHLWKIKKRDVTQRFNVENAKRKSVKRGRS